jgi:hypothetical protein
LNKKHHFLDDKVWLLKSLQNYYPQELADLHGIKRGSIDWAMRFFTPEQLMTTKVGRKGKKFLAKIEEYTSVKGD